MKLKFDELLSEVDNVLQKRRVELLINNHISIIR